MTDTNNNSFVFIVHDVDSPGDFVIIVVYGEADEGAPDCEGIEALHAEVALAKEDTLLEILVDLGGAQGMVEDHQDDIVQVDQVKGLLTAAEEPDIAVDAEEDSHDESYASSKKNYLLGIYQLY